MVWIQAGSKPDEFTQHETFYQTNYGRWNGLVDRSPVFRQIVEIRAASVFSSWTIKGSHEKTATRVLDEMKGRNVESFKEIMANLYKIAYICGDAYAEKIYDGDPEDGNIVDLHILPSDNIRQVIEKGKIKRFEEIDGGAKWAPWRIFHVKYNPRGAMTHGIGMVESNNNILVSYEQMVQLGQEIYERMIKPRELILANTDNETKLQKIRDAIKEAGDSWSGIAVLPKTLIDDIKHVILNPALKPQEWLDALNKEIFKATATPEIVLGTGYSTSEEDAKTRIAGFMGSIRYDQERFEDMVRKQLFEEMWPTNPPEIEFSFTQEAFDNMYNRKMDTIAKIDASPTIAPENKDGMIEEILSDVRLVT